MNRLEHLLTILTEECAEVQQAVTKSLRFGLEEGRNLSSITYKNNVQKLRYEINDLWATVEMLEKEGLDLSPDQILIKQKKDNIEKYLIYSIKRGTLSDGLK